MTTDDFDGRGDGAPTGSHSEAGQTLTCYRHPDRPTRVRCQRCERPICPEDMHPGAVGFLCPDDAKQRTQVRTMQSLYGDPQVTYGALGVIAIVFLVQQVGGNAIVAQFALAPIAAGFGAEPWRLVTSAFLHAGLLHVGFNGYLLYLLGKMLEPSMGSLRFGLLYLAGLLGGSLGVVLLANPRSLTLGASGAVFGLMGGAMLGLRRRGINPWRSQIGTLVLLNLGITFFLPGISIGGHVGGLIGGAAAGWALFTFEHRRTTVGTLLVAGLCALLAVAGILLAPVA